MPDPVAPVDHCDNQTLDAELGETDLDCGGDDCPACELGRHCLSAEDCAGAPCIDEVCQEPGCANDAHDGDESGVDCGGSCEPCRDGEPCLETGDCESKVCGADGLCASVTCDDGVRNGDELGVDCGGAFCDEGCGVGDPCHAATDCQSGLCDATTLVCALNCSRGTDECDGNTDDPCETNLLTSNESCGACGNVCDLPHASSSCTGGVCQIDECAKPWLRCNSDAADGCEINGGSDAANCGGCGIVCPDFHGTPKCVSAKCVIECAPAFGDCDEDPDTGCERSLNDVDHCGACDNACPDDDGVPNCVGGKCGVADCRDGLGDCDGDGTCDTHLDEDPANCGRCGNVCGIANGDAACAAGRCVVTSCDPGRDNCDAGAADGGYANGCEADLTSAASCGACGKVCSGATPNCVATDGKYRCQARITVGNASPYPSATAAAGSLSFNVTPRAGTNRLVLVAVVSDALHSNAVSAGIAGARPGSVKFGTQTMTAGPSQVGANDAYSPDLFVYYLPLGDAAADGAPVAVSISGSTGPANVVVAQSLQLNGVRQTMPITSSGGGAIGAPDPDDPGTATAALPIGVSGSVIYSFISDYWDTRTCALGARSSGCPAWSATPAQNLTLIQTMATAPLTFYPPDSGTAPMRAFGMLVTADSPAWPAVGTYKPTWSDPNPGRLTHLAVVIAPAQAP